MAKGIKDNDSAQQPGAGEQPLRVFCVIGSSCGDSATHIVVRDVAQRIRSLGSQVDVFDPCLTPLPLFNPQLSFSSPVFLDLKARVDAADAFVFASPDYHGSISSTLKNFLDHFWKEFAGKLFSQIVASPDKGLTVIDQLRTVSRQCYAWSLPYGVSFVSSTDIRDGRIATDSLAEKVEMLVNDLQVYGHLLSRQRNADLACSRPSFLARSRPVAESVRSVRSGSGKLAGIR